jgi:hypothetical protein
MAIMSKEDFFLKSMTDEQKTELFLLEQKINDILRATEFCSNLEIDITGVQSEVLHIVRAKCEVLGWEVDFIDGKRMFIM